MSERISKITNWKKTIGDSDAYIHAMIPSVFSVIHKAYKLNISQIVERINKLKEESNPCEGMFYVNPILSNENPSKRKSFANAYDKQPIISNSQADQSSNSITAAFKDFISEVGKNSQSPYSSFKVRFNIDCIMTSIGPYFIFSFSMLSPCYSKDVSRFSKPKFTLFQLTLL
jgi:hypothetical protein